MNRPHFGLHRYLVALLLTAAATLFGWAPAQAGVPTIYSFNYPATAADGTSPQLSPLTKDAVGNLWGTCYSGGSASGYGTVYEILQGTTTPVTIHAFTGGTTDGEYPGGGLVLVGTTLYGVTLEGGTGNDGTYYSIAPNGSTTTAGGTYTALNTNFKSSGSLNTTGVNLYNPIGTPVQGPTGDTTHVYVCSEDGGSSSRGAVMEITATTGQVNAQYSIYAAASDYGEYPYGNLCLGRSASAPYFIYGTTFEDSKYGNGEIFALQVPGLATTSFSVYFMKTLFGSSTSHGYPYSGLVQGLAANSDTNLYGTTSDVDASGYGSVYKVTPTPGTTTVTFSAGTNLHSFAGSAADGSTPECTLAWDSAGANLYGTSTGGDAGVAGTVFRLTYPALTYQVVYDFTGSASTSTADGYEPYSGLLYNSYDTSFYGNTIEGGTGSNAGTTDGTDFRIGPPFTYKKTYFTNVNTAVPMSLAWSDTSWAAASGITQTAYSINGGVAATAHGSIAGTLSGATVPASPIARTYTPTTSYTGVDSFNYTISNSLGTSLSTYGLTTIYVGALTPSYTLLPTTGMHTDTYADLVVTPAFTDTTLTYTWSTTGTPPAPVVFSQDSGNSHGGNGTNGAQYGIDATFTKIGTYNFQCLVTAPDGTTTTLTLTIVVPNTGTGFAITPTTATVEIGGTQTFTAGSTDQFGNVSGTGVTYSATGDGTVGSTTGQFTANATTTGTATVTATNGTSTAPATVTVVASTPVLTAAASAAPSPVTAKTTTLKATATYAGGSANLTYTWVETSGPTGVTFSAANGTSTGGAGTVATFTQAGTYVFTVTIANPHIPQLSSDYVTSSVTVTVNSTLTTITIAPAAGATGTGTNANPVQIMFGSTQQFTASGVDQFGNTVSGGTVNWQDYSLYYDDYELNDFTFPLSTSGLYTANDLTTDAVGANEQIQVDNTAGTTFSNTLYIDILDPAVTGTVNGVACTTASPLTIYTNTATAAVNGYNAGALAVLTFKWNKATVTGDLKTETFSPSSSAAAYTSTVTFPTVGTYPFFCNPTDQDGDESFASVPSTTNLTVIVVQAPTTITLSPTSATVPLGGSQTFTSTVKDQWGNTMSTQPVTYTVTTGPGTTSGAVYFAPNSTSPLPGSAVVTASSSVAGQPTPATATANITITDVTPTGATLTASPSTLPTSGASPETTTLSANATYPGGLSNLTFTYAASPSGYTTFSGSGVGVNSPTATFSKAGTYTITVTIKSPTGLSTTAQCTVTVNQQATGVTVTPNPASINISSTQQFTAVETDQFGNAMSTQPTFTWGYGGGPGSINSSTGLFSATGTSGSGTVSATDSSNTAVEGFANITINDVAPTISGVSWTDPVNGSDGHVSGTSEAFTVSAAYVGGTSKLTYSWSATGPYAVNSWTPNGTNAASTTTAVFAAYGTYTVTVTATTPTNLQTMFSFAVHVDQTGTSIIITPSPASGPIGGTINFTADEKDQFGADMVSQPTITWSRTGVGSINSSTGVFTDGAVIGTAVVTATDGTLSAQANVSIVNSPPMVTVAAAASPNPVTSGTTTNLSVTATYAGGNSLLAYTWSATGPAAVTYSDNGDNSAQNCTATFTQSGIYYFTVVINDGAGGSTSSTVTVTVKQKLVSVVVIPSAETIKIGDTYNFNAQANDQFGQAIAPQPTFAFSISSGGGSIDPVTGVYSAPLTTTVATIVATASGISGNGTCTVIDSAPTFAQDPSANPNPVLNTTTNLSCLGAYIAGESNLTYTWSATGPGTVTYSDNGDNTAKSCTATFSAVGSYVFTATITTPGGKTDAETVNVTVEVNPNTVTVTPNPANLSIGGSKTFTAVVTDQFGNVVSSPPLTWSLNTGTAGTINSSGVYIASTTPGTYTVTASCSENGQTAIGSATINLSDVAPTVGPITVNPNPVTGNTASLSVTGTYAGPGSLSYSWTTTAGPATVSFTGGTSGTTGNAVTTTAQFSQAGTYTVKVTVGDGYGTTTTQTVTFTVVQTASGIVVSPPSASVILLGSTTFTANVVDQFGTALTTQPSITWSVTAGGGSVNSSGTYTAPNTTGTATIQAAASGFTGTGAVTINDSPITIATHAAASPNPVTGTTTNLSVLGAWAGGESNLTYTWSASGPASVTFSANGTNASKASTATFTAAGTYAFTVTITDTYGNTNSSGVSVVVNQTLTTITVTPNPGAVAILGTLQFTATANDQFGTAFVTPPIFNWILGTGTPGSISNTTGLYTASSTAGSGIVKAGSGTVIGSATVYITNVLPTLTAAAKATPSPVTGTTTTLTAMASWVGGASNLTYTWSQTAGPATATFDSNNGTNAGSTCVATFTQAGSYTFLCTIADPNGGSITSSVNVTVNQTPTTVIVSPTTGSTVIGGGFQVSGTVNDQFGTQISPIPTITWSVSSGAGSVSSSGLYTAPTTTGTATVTGTVGSSSANCGITINDAPPTVATPASATPNPVTAKTTALSVLGAYPGGESTLTYTWSATGPATVTYSANGTNAAKASTATFTKAGSYVFTVTIKNASGLTATSQVTVTVNQTATGVTVTPNPVTTTTGGTIDFSASAVDQFGNAMSTQPTFTWSVSAGVGSINSSTGVYTAPGTAGTATVKATAGTASGTAAVTIIAGHPPTLSGSASNPGPGSVNLTTEGTTDWIHYGRGIPGVDQMAGVPANLTIGTYTLVGSTNPSLLSLDPRAMSWTNGTPTASSPNNHLGVQVTGIGDGFTFAAPADVTLRTLVVYVGGKNATGKLTAHISDGTSSDYVNSQTFTTTQGDTAYTFSYAAGSSGQTLQITWVVTAGSGAISIAAADLH